MTCFEKYKQEHAGEEPDVTKRCPNISGGIYIADPDYCNSGGSNECYQCWNREIPVTTITKEECFREITIKMADVYAAKNHDYGNSFARLRERYPISILIRLFDKLNRLETLLTDECVKVKDESIEDTLLDLANYAIMELVERKMNRRENQ